MTFKDELRAVDPRPGAASPDRDNIARLLRELNEDLNDGSARQGLTDEDEDRRRDPRGGLPMARIAVALLVAGGIAFGVVMLDHNTPAPADDAAPAPVLAAARPPATESLITRSPGPAQPAPAAAAQPAAAPTQQSPTQQSPTLPNATQQTPTAQTPTPQTPPPPPAAVQPAPSAAAAPPAQPASRPVAPAPAAPPSVTTNAAPTNTAELQALLRSPAPAQPPAPQPPATQPQAARPAAGQAQSAPTQSAQPQTAQLQTAARPAAPARQAAPAGNGRYAVQVGSFTVSDNAEALVRKLADQGYNAYAFDWTDRNQRAWRTVRVGNFASDAEARRAADELKRLNLPTSVVTTR